MNGRVEEADQDLAPDTDGDAHEVDPPESQTEVGDQGAGCPGPGWPTRVPRRSPPTGRTGWTRRTTRGDPPSGRWPPGRRVWPGAATIHQDDHGPTWPTMKPMTAKRSHAPPSAVVARRTRHGVERRRSGEPGPSPDPAPATGGATGRGRQGPRRGEPGVDGRPRAPATPGLAVGDAARCRLAPAARPPPPGASAPPRAAARPAVVDRREGLAHGRRCPSTRSPPEGGA